MSSEAQTTHAPGRAWLTFKPFTQILTFAAVAFSALTPLAHAALVSGQIFFDGLVVVNNGGGGNETAVTGWGTTTNSGGSGSFATVPPVGAVPSFAPGTWSFGSTVAIPNFWTVGGFSFKLVHSQVEFDQQNFVLVVFEDAVVSGNGYTPTVCSGYFQFQGATVGGYTPLVFNCASTGVGAAPVLPVLSLTTISKKQVLTWTDSSYLLQCSPSLTNTFTNIPKCHESLYQYLHNAEKVLPPGPVVGIRRRAVHTFQ